MSRKLLIGIICLIVLIAGSLMGVKWWIENEFFNLLNRNPDRAYDITYEDLDLHLFFKGLSLESPKITPLNVADTATQVQGTLDNIEINGIKWGAFLLQKKAIVRELAFINPEFKINLVETGDKQGTHKVKPLQTLFGDILTRGEIHSFRLVGGSAVTMRAEDSVVVVNIHNLEINAIDIQTDSIQVQNLIPFKLTELHTSLDSSAFLLNDYTELTTGLISYNSTDSQLELNNINMAFTKDRIAVSEIVGKQVDLIEAKIGQLKISQLEAGSDLSSDVRILAGSILIDGLVLSDFRDKNKQRPPDVEKPMFSGMLGSVSLPLKVDSITIINSEFNYTELGEGKSEMGTVQFANIDGTIKNVTTMPEYQNLYQGFDGNLKASLNGKADLSFALQVPYDQETFTLTTVIQPFHLDVLNQTVTPLAGIEVASGTAHSLRFDMGATQTQAVNRLKLDYDSLSLSVLADQKHHHNKKGIISVLANSAIRRSNMPEQKHYQIAEYHSFRNVNRGPFNFIWESIKEGMLYIVPTGASSILLGDPEKKAKHQREKKKSKKKT